MTIAITRLDLISADLRQAARQTEDANAARRMLAIALLLDGWWREAAAEACGMDRQTLRDWVHRYNASGLDGLSNRPRRNGPPARLSEEQQAEIAKWVEEGADLERDGVVRWRCRVGVSPWQLSQSPGLGYLRGHPRCVRERLERPMRMPDRIASITRRSWAIPVIG